jgi:trk system potassium uptake protein TrkA
MGGQLDRTLDVRAKYKVNIIAVRDSAGKLTVAPGADYILQAQDVVITLGRNEDINRLHGLD